MDADGLRIKVQRQANFDKGLLDFWHKLKRKALVEGRAVAIAEDVPFADDANRTRTLGTREVAGQTFGYLLVLTRTNDEVCSYEAWGPNALFDRRLDELTKSARTLRR